VIILISGSRIIASIGTQQFRILTAYAFSISRNEPVFRRSCIMARNTVFLMDNPEIIGDRILLRVKFIAIHKESAF